MNANPATFARERDQLRIEDHRLRCCEKSTGDNLVCEDCKATSIAYSEAMAPVRSIRLVLPYPVSANRYWRSFVPRGASRAITCVSDEAKAYKRDVFKLALTAGVTPIRGRVRVVIELYPHRPLDWSKRARKDPDGWADSVQCLDLDNARKVLNDALKNIAFEDDKWIKQDAGSICEPDEHGARVVVTITPIVRLAVAPELFA